MNIVHKTIEVAGITVKIQELTVAEIRDALKMEESDGKSAADSDAVDMFLFEDISLPDIRRMTDLTIEKMAGMKPSELRQVAETCREVNSDFFSLRGRVLKYADLLTLADVENNLPITTESS
jgi:hypothetical protein